MSDIIFMIIALINFNSRPHPQAGRVKREKRRRNGNVKIAWIQQPFAFRGSPQSKRDVGALESSTGGEKGSEILHFNELKTKIFISASTYFSIKGCSMFFRLAQQTFFSESKLQEMKTEMHFLPRYEQFRQKAIFLVYQNCRRMEAKLKGESTSECKLQETVNCII